MPAVVWATDAGLRFTLSEGGGLVALGLGPGDVVGQTILAYFGTEDATHPPVAAHVRALAGHPQVYELDWNGRTYLSHLEPLRADGEIVGVVGVAIDITERKRSERQLEAANSSLRRSEAARRDLIYRLVSAQEDEARRIAADVHDGPVQSMVAIGMRLHLLRELITDERARTAIGQLEELTESTIAAQRHLLTQLASPDLEEGGLAVAIGCLLEDLHQSFGITTSLDDQLTTEPPATVATNCYRLVQEAITNVGKHAQATRLTVLLGSSHEGIHVTVRDDGVGFDPLNLPERGHVGLVSMQERARAVGGRLEVHSTVGEGTLVDCWLPLQG